MFVAMSSPQPTCPHCGSIKLIDGGEAMNIMLGGGGDAARIDAGLREIADHHGMTNMSNKGGKPVKGNAGEARGDFGKINVNGVNVPVDHNPTVSRVPMTSHLKVKPMESASGRPANVLGARG
jgi:hypothetical protein